MLTLTRKCDYALIALSHLSRFPDTVTSAREVSDQYKIPLPVLMNILKQLTREGIITSVRGARGGYRLAVDARELTLKSLILAIEGPVRLVRCADLTSVNGDGEKVEPCLRIDCCPVRGPVLQLHHKLDQFLAGVTLSDIVDPPIKLQTPEPGPAGRETNEPSVSG